VDIVREMEVAVVKEWLGPLPLLHSGRLLCPDREATVETRDCRHKQKDRPTKMAREDHGRTTFREGEGGRLVKKQ